MINDTALATAFYQCTVLWQCTILLHSHNLFLLHHPILASPKFHFVSNCVLAMIGCVERSVEIFCHGGRGQGISCGSRLTSVKVS